jgi:hypothetical protein
VVKEPLSPLSTMLHTAEQTAEWLENHRHHN